MFFGKGKEAYSHDDQTEAGALRTGMGLGKQGNGLCGVCQKQQTVKHILMECTGLTRQREHLYAAVESLGTTPVTLKSLLNPIENQPGTIKTVLDFITATGLFLWK